MHTTQQPFLSMYMHLHMRIQPLYASAYDYMCTYVRICIYIYLYACMYVNGNGKDMLPHSYA